MKKSLSSKQAYDLVCELAKKKGLSLREYAKECGMSHSVICHFRDDNRKTLSLDVALRLGIVKIVKV